jgi:hypothetical protein
MFPVADILPVTATPVPDIVAILVLPACKPNTPEESAVCIIPLVVDALMVDGMFYPYSI